MKTWPFFSLLIALFVAACSTPPAIPQASLTAEKPASEPPEAVEEEPAKPPTCKGLDGELLDTCRRALAILKSICPDSDVGGEGCNQCPQIGELDSEPAPYGLRNIAPARDQSGEVTESQFLMMEGCSEDRRTSVILASPGDHVTPWRVAAFTWARDPNLANYRFATSCKREDSASIAQCTTEISVVELEKMTIP